MGECWVGGHRHCCSSSGSIVGVVGFVEVFDSRNPRVMQNLDPRDAGGQVAIPGERFCESAAPAGCGVEFGVVCSGDPGHAVGCLA